jgi:predicted SAM-dependent methyltransferase
MVDERRMKMAEIKKRMKDYQSIKEEAVVEAVTEVVELIPDPPAATAPEKKPVKLNLGCGFRKFEGFINIDMREIVKPDLLHDITKPFPYADSSVDLILADDILEHVPPDDVIPVLREIHRILKPEGVLQFSIPSTDSRGAYMDPTHRSFWNINSWLYFTDGEWHALYPEFPAFKRIEIRDETSSEKLRIIHTRGKVSPLK